MAYDEKWDAEARHKLKEEAPEDFAGPGETFPIKTQDDLEHAAELLHHADDPSAVKKRAITIAKRKGLALPKTWASDKTADAAREKDEPVCPECGTVMEWEPRDGKCNHCGSNKAPVPPSQHQAKKAADPSDVEGDSVDVLVADSAGEWQVLADGVRDGLMRVRQLFTIADSVNANDRAYPRALLQDAIERARPIARAGAMIGTLRHPPKAKGEDGNHYFADTEAKAARIDDIEDVDADGRVYGTRTILDTPHGRIVADAFRAKKPLGVSVRWRIPASRREKVGGRTIEVPLKLDWLNLDDVGNPACPQTSRDYQLLTDEARAQLGLPTGHPNDRHDKETQVAMNAKIRSALNDVYAAINRRVPVAELNALRKIVSDEIELARRANEDISEAVHASLKADSAASVAGYHADRDGPNLVENGGAGQGGRKAGEGWGKDLEAGQNEPNDKLSKIKSEDNKDENMGGDKDKKLKGDGTGLTEDEVKAIRDRMKKEEEDKAEAEREEEVDKKADACRADTMKGLATDDQDLIIKLVKAAKPRPEDVPQLVADQVSILEKRLAQERLRGRGYDPNSTLRGQTVTDGANPVKNDRPAEYVGGGHLALDEAFKDVRGRTPECMEMVGQLLLAGDDHIRKSNVVGADNPNDPRVHSIRKSNLKKLFPIINDIARESAGCASMEEWFTKCDALTADSQGVMKKLNDNGALKTDSAGGVILAEDADTTSNFFNQPTIMIALLIQRFWGQKMLRYYEAIGPGMAEKGSPGWYDMPDNSRDGIGTVLRIPIEYLNQANMSGYAGATTPYYTPGGLVPENTGIDYISVATNWLTFKPTWKRGAVQPTRDAIRAMGNGPLNLNVVGRELFHLGWFIERIMDKFMADEMLNASDEYGAVAVTGETCTFADNSVYPASGAVTVNLNPTKTAVSAVAATDPSVTYGTSLAGALSNGALVACAIRLVCGGNSSSSPYCGNSQQAATNYGVTPIVRPRTAYTLSQQGSLSTSTTNPVTLTLTGTGAAAVQGFLDVASGTIQPQAGVAGTPNWAVDWENGVIVFSAGFTSLVANAGVAANASGDTTTFAYSYATNYDNFTLTPAFASLATGETYQQYLMALMEQVDATAAYMSTGTPGVAQTGRFMPPDFLLTDPITSAAIVNAQNFYQWVLPKGTELFPTEEFFALRNGIMMGRTAVPWLSNATRALLGQIGAGKYAMDTPFEVRGPQFPYDSNGRPVASEVYFGAENSVVCTPQVTDQNGNIINPCYRTIRMR